MVVITSTMVMRKRIRIYLNFFFLPFFQFLFLSFLKVIIKGRGGMQFCLCFNCAFIVTLQSLSIYFPKLFL